MADERFEYDELDAKVAEFLGELEGLCKRYGFGIAACGCCDSPWLTVDKGNPGNREYTNLFVGRVDDEFVCSVERACVLSGDCYVTSAGEVKVAESFIKGFEITKDGKRD